MSLRVDIHEAIDEVAADERVMAARVVAAMAFTPALAEQAGRRPRRWTSPLRSVASLVAVLLVVVLVTSLLVGGRVLSDWSSFGARPQPGPRLDTALVAQLEARPLLLHAIPASVDCPTGPYSSYAGWGSGPVSMIGGLPRHSGWGNYFNGLVYTSVSLSGPVIGRGMDLRTGQAVVFIADHAYGPVSRSDVLEGKTVRQHTEVLLDTDHPPQTVTDGGKLYVWGVRVGLDKAASGCTGFQFDGAGFDSETFAVSGGWAGLDFYWPPSD